MINCLFKLIVVMRGFACDDTVFLYLKGRKYSLLSLQNANEVFVFNIISRQ